MAARLPTSYFHTYFRAELRGRRRPVRFAVVTAHNPLGKKSSPAANRRRDAALRRHLKALRIKHFRVTGGSKDGSHREPGWGLVADSPEAARALAALFKQRAYFWISARRVFLGSSAGGRLRRAGSWPARQARW
ncbi:MAG: DUF3293 domain-containing protein [Elusimicrobia bacterium]|nr:DUF3293 domain-containing protein [Elusimicrobiota bacterium]